MSHVDRTCEPWDLCIFRLQWEPYSSTHFMLPRKYRVRQSRRRRHGVDRFACAAKLLDAVLSRAEDNRPRALPPALVECTIRIRHSNLYYAHLAHIFNHRESSGRPAWFEIGSRSKCDEQNAKASVLNNGSSLILLVLLHKWLSPLLRYILMACAIFESAWSTSPRKGLNSKPSKTTRNADALPAGWFSFLFIRCPSPLEPRLPRILAGSCLFSPSESSSVDALC